MFAREAKEGFFHMYIHARGWKFRSGRKKSLAYILLGEMARARMALELGIGHLNRALLLSTKVRHLIKLAKIDYPLVIFF
jgi:hypothetical protein